MRYDDLHKLVERIVSPQECKIIFSLFAPIEDEEGETDPSTVRVPDLLSPEALWPGQVQFVINYWRFGDSTRRSPVINNPTWRDLVIDCMQQFDGQIWR